MRFLTCATFIFIACKTVPPAEVNVIQTDQGPVRGAARPGLTAFLGVPYAAAPVGALRWKPPIAPPSWSKPRDATHFGPACPQPIVGGVARPTSEDCLSLNLWVPEGAHHAPVMVWLHGGGFYTGSNLDPLYDGAKLAAQTGTIVVNLNYRLGALGFLAHRELGTASVGLLDQQAALRWVARNISNFGGDPANVTLFGESAGAWSTCAHLAMPKSRGLFAKAIMQSGACSDALYFSREQALAQGESLAQAVGCDDAACLRELPVDKLISALPMKRSMLLPPGVWWGPVVDGATLPELPLEAMRAGRSYEVPLIYGWAKDEGVMHTIHLDEVQPEEIVTFMRDHFGEAAARAMPKHYPGPKWLDALNDVVTDGVYACSTRRVANLLSDRGVPVFVYELTHPLDDPGPHDLGATHSVDLFFVFGNEDRITFSEREHVMSREVMNDWGNFARSGVPRPSWPRWTSADQQHVTLDVQSEVHAAPKKELCDAWDAVER